METHSADEFIAHFGQGDLGTAVAFCMEQLSLHFLPGSPRYSARHVYRVYHGDQCVERVLAIEANACRLEQAIAPHSTVTIVTVFLPQPSGLVTLLECIAGIRHFDACYRMGAVQVEGDLLLAADALKWFYAP